MYQETYYGQPIEGFTHIGNDQLKFELTGPDVDVESLVSELYRRCGKSCEINLYREEVGVSA